VVLLELSCTLWWVQDTETVLNQPHTRDNYASVERLWWDTYILGQFILNVNSGLRPPVPKKGKLTGINFKECDLYPCADWICGAYTWLLGIFRNPPRSGWVSEM